MSPHWKLQCGTVPCSQLRPFRSCGDCHYGLFCPDWCQPVVEVLLKQPGSHWGQAALGDSLES